MIDDAPEPLTTEEGRVIGCLLEKQATVPDTYPMTLNGLRGACNQSSNRDPVVSYDDSTVLRALDSLKSRGLVRFVHASHGARTTKYRHVLDEAIGLDSGELAALSVLLLRGPQTAAEVRARAERQHSFESVAEVEALLGSLAARERPLVRLLEREPGRREQRWTQLLADHAGPAPAATHSAAPPGEATDGPAGAEVRHDEVATLRAEVTELRRRFDLLLQRLGESDL